MAKAVRVQFKGNFFKGDPKKKLSANIKDLMDELAESGERDVVGQLKAGEAARYPLGGRIIPGRVSGWVQGRTESLSRKDWRKTAVVSVRPAGLDRKQAIKLAAAASWLESQTHAFRRTAGRIRRAKTDLAKGLN